MERGTGGDARGNPVAIGTGMRGLAVSGACSTAFESAVGALVARGELHPHSTFPAGQKSVLFLD